MMFGTTILGVTITALWAMMLFILWVAIAFWPARVAARKGHSFLGFFLLSLLFFPLSLLIAYMSEDRLNPAHARS